VRVLRLRVRTFTEEVVVRPVALVGGVRNAIPLVEALVGGVATSRVSEVPLAENGGDVACVGDASPFS
jgi:hypothetical protein